ncbi:HMA2 domain-containing protein [Marinifilum caeruleilacunae]|uniref:Heavy-metal-associated domain-containing protein n=1 Tax=Marinifilum caeruleilacunae TaxID=2499076 RepID=A0ABX1WX72_9BACT|nr:hypothetical protein [Marinifilum caeruleilacunae]NOU60717.1 hypothetical protein [Marinifilum caeruleilacunae]
MKGFKGFKGIVEIMHLIPGRVRFLVPTLKNEPDKCKQLKTQLEKAEQINGITPNPITGKVLIEFDKDHIDVETLTGVLVKLLGLEKSIEKSPNSMLTKELKDLFKSLNTGVYEYTNGVMDLRSLVTTSFIGFGAYSMIVKRNLMPPGLNFLYWAYMNLQKP